MTPSPLPAIFLKRREERRLAGGHLWFYSNEIDTGKTPLKVLQAGDQVRLYSHSGSLLGSAYVNPNTLLCGRLFSRREESLGDALIHQRLRQALELRRQLFKKPYYRLIYAEADLLPGLIVDRYGDQLSVQINTAGMARLQDEIIGSLVETLDPKAIFLRNDSGIRAIEGLDQYTGDGYGKADDLVRLEENGVVFTAPLRSGQKTGWFYDQRDNRALIKTYAQNRRVLDVFCYVGGFGIAAAVGGGTEVFCVDSSRSALDLVQDNARLNGVADRVTAIQGDGFEVLRHLLADGEQFSMIVVDPPAFIKRKKDHKPGLAAYQKIVEAAVRLLSPGGLLLAASCSMHLQRAELQDVVRRAALSTNRDLQVLVEGGQGPDHPVHPAISETRYLKALLCHLP